MRRALALALALAALAVPAAAVGPFAEINSVVRLVGGGGRVGHGRGARRRCTAGALRSGAWSKSR
jgi:hypothetical protein